MPVSLVRGMHRHGALALAWIGCGGVSAVLAQAPASTPLPAPTVTSTVSAARVEQLEERLRKMDEVNQKLIGTVQDLSKRLDAVTKKAQGTQSGAGAAGTDSVRGTRGDNISLSVRGNSAPPTSPSLSQPKKGPLRTPLTGFYDQRQRNRYGYVLQSEDEEFELRVNGLLQVDSRIYQQRNQTPVSNDIDIPRARMFFSGRLTKPIEYQVSFQRGTNGFDLLNAFLNFHYDDRFQIRLGRYRAPFTYDWAKLSTWELLTPERTPFAANFGPNRQVGIQAWGNVFQDRLEYAVGIFDGPRNSYQDTNYSKDIMSFIDFRPFYPQKGSPLKNLSLGGSVDAGKQDNPPVPNLLRTSVTASGNTLSTSSGDNLIAAPFLAFNNNVREKGQRTLWELHANYFYKGLSVLAAWDSGHDDYSLTTRNARPVHLPVSGYSVQVGYIVTGESLEKRALVEPIHPFDLRRGTFGLGALELYTRYSELQVGNQVFTAGLADRNLWSNQVNLIDVGFNWYLNKWVKLYFDWENAVYGQPVYFRPGPGLQKTSDMFWLRAQLYF